MNKITKFKENYSIKESTFKIELECYYDGKTINIIQIMI